MIVCGWRSKVTFTDNDRNRCTASVGSKHICANPPLDYKPWLSKTFLHAEPKLSAILL